MTIENLQETLTINFGVALTGQFPGGGGLSLTVGTLRMYGFNFMPGGTAQASGQLLPITGNEVAFAVVGDAFGGDGQTIFGMPDLRGKLAIGVESFVSGAPEIGDTVGEVEITIDAASLPLSSGGEAVPVDNTAPSTVIIYAINTGGFLPASASGSAQTGFIGQIQPFATNGDLSNLLPRGWVPADGRILPVSANPALFSVIGTTYGGDGRISFALPDLRGHVPIGADPDNGLNLGDEVGSDEIRLEQDNLPAEFGGAGEALDNRQPSLAVNYLVVTSGLFPSNGFGEPDPDTPFVGEITMSAGDVVPSGYALADGQLLPIATNTALLGVLGGQYGEIGRTTFALPDFRGRAATQVASDTQVGQVQGENFSTIEASDLAGLIVIDAPDGPGATFNAGIAGEQDVVKVLDLSFLAIEGSWTVEAWVSTFDDDAQFNRIVRNPVGGGQNYSLLVKDGQAHVRFDNGSSAQVLQAGPNIADGGLHHLVGVFDSVAGELILYVDGDEVGRGPAAGTPIVGFDSLEIGGTTGASGQNFDGTIAEVRIWESARTQDEIRGASFSVTPASEPELLLQMAFPNGEPTILSEQSLLISTIGTLDAEPTYRITKNDVLDFGVQVLPSSSDLATVLVSVEPNSTMTVAGSVAGLTVTGNGTSQITLDGPVEDINTLLQTLQVIPNTNYEGASSVRVDVTIGATSIAQVYPFFVAEIADVPSLEVTTLDDVVDAFDQVTSLREALTLANSVDDALGDGLPDEITFADNLQGGTLQWGDSVTGPDFFTITDDLIIRGDIELRGRGFGVPETILAITNGEVALEGLQLTNAGLGLRADAGTDVTLRDVTISLHFFEGRTGGGIRSEGELSIFDSLIANNTTGDSGGGIFQSGGSLTLHDSIVSGNRVSSASAYSDLGAAGITLTNGAVGYVSNSLIINNRSYSFQGDTGGLKVEAGSSATVVNTTFHGNTSSHSFAGYDSVGSIFNDSSTLSLTQVTVTAGVGSEVGGVQTIGTGASTVIRNSIVLGNTGSTDFSEIGATSPVFEGINIVGADGAAFDASGDPNVINADPNAVFDTTTGTAGQGSLAGNGGPVQTVALKADLTNPALDAGDDSLAPATDARGELRLVNIDGVANNGTNAVDLGAYEIQRTPTRGPDIQQGDATDETLVGSPKADLLDGGAGSDTADYSASGAAVVVASDGAFAIGGDADGDTLTDIENLLGSAFADFLRGDGQANVLTGGAGADYIQGRGGDDTLNGGENDDLLEPGAGADTVDGGAGQDLLSALDAAGPVTINLGNVALSSAGYADKTLISIEGVLGVAGFGNTLVGGGGEDLLIGGDGADSISGAGGADILLGLGGADTISGGAGDDLILGLEGDDVLTGDAGRDLFLFEPGDGADVVTDFELPVGGSGFEDRLFFSGLGLTFADLDIAEVGGDVVIGYGTNPAAFDGSVTVEGVTLAELVPGGAQPDWILVF